MSRCLIALAAAFLAGTALGDELAPKLQLASVEGDNFVVHDVAVVPEQRVEKRTRVVNGVTQEYQVTVTRHVEVTRKLRFPLADTLVHEANGARCSPAQVRELLRKPRAVVIAPSPKLSKEMRELLKDDALVVVLSAVP